MEESLNIIYSVQNLILDPGKASILPLFISSLLNDILGLLPFSLVLAGQLANLSGEFNVPLLAKLLVFVSVPVGIGSAIGCLPVYAASYFGGKPLISQSQKLLRFSWADVEKVSRNFKGLWYDEVIFLLLRAIPILPSMPLNIAAGIIRMRPWPFWFLTAVGSIIRMMLTLLVVGFSLWGIINL